MKIINTFEPESQEWLNYRAKFLTASNWNTLKGKSETRSTLLYEIAGARLGIVNCDPIYSNDNMRNGNEREEIARGLYELQYNCEIIKHPFIEKTEEYEGWCGYSPDGIVECSRELPGELWKGEKLLSTSIYIRKHKKGIEIKSPKLSTYIKVKSENYIDPKYYDQIQFAYFCNEELEEFDYVVYYPEQPLIIIPVERDRESQKKIAEDVERCIGDVEGIINKIKTN